MAAEGQGITYKLVVGVLLVIVGFFGTMSYSQLLAIQKDLVALQVAVARVQSEIIGRQEIKQMIADECLKYHFKEYNQSKNISVK